MHHASKQAISVSKESELLHKITFVNEFFFPVSEIGLPGSGKLI